MFASLASWTPLLIPAFIVLDLITRKRSYTRPHFWRTRALAVTIGIFVLTGQVAMFWANLFGDYHLLDLSGLGTWAGAAVGIFVYELCHYGYHRAVHSYDLLWRGFGHQMHHSAESLDAWGANFLHPLDAAMFTTWASLVFVPLLGLTTEAAIVGAFFLLFNAMFQHANIATPYWLGYIIQRPESHNLHHGRGVHRYNYADLPIIDMLFGTFRNPHTLRETPCGFYTGASSRIGAMLLGRDVSTPAKTATLSAEAQPG